MSEHCPVCGMSPRGDFLGNRAALAGLTDLHVKPCKACGFKFGEDRL